MNAMDMKARTKKFALAVLGLSEHFPRTKKAQIIEGQLLRAGTSVGANYRAACRARSKAEFIAKIGNVIEEADESAFWLELAEEGEILKSSFTRPLWNEADQLTAIMTRSRQTAEASQRRDKS